jgi:hypothetical protein
LDAASEEKARGLIERLSYIPLDKLDSRPLNAIQH